jgi:hypothetical protein
MTLHQAFAAGAPAMFRARLQHRLKQLAKESGRDELVLPVGIFLLLDEANGGDATAQELAKRFRLLDFESRNVVDFYFVGWEQDQDGLSFDVRAFAEFRDALRRNGVRHFGGNADLILADARLSGGVTSLDFSLAIRVDLARAVAEGLIPTLGGFLQSVVEAADQVHARAGRPGESAVFSISDRLSLAIAGRSLLDYIFDKWGKIVGAKRLEAVAVRKLGPEVALRDFT